MAKVTVLNKHPYPWAAYERQALRAQLKTRLASKREFPEIIILHGEFDTTSVGIVLGDDRFECTVTEASDPSLPFTPQFT